jgi:hypothetical protein
MSVFKTDARSGFIFVALLTAMIILGGCSGVKYIYNPGTTFSGLNSYAWIPASGAGQEPLVVTNVQFIADQVLEKKGFKKTASMPNLLISIDNGYERSPYYDGYQLRMLSLNIFRGENKELIWRGTAPYDINTDADSSDLENAVQDILAKFPPK